MEGCVFCRIVRGEIATEKLFEDDLVCAFADIAPSAPVHVLIVPKKHVEGVGSLVEEDEKAYGRIVRIAGVMAKKMGVEKAFKLAVNGGRFAEVKHLHFHLLGGWPEGGEI